MYKMSTEVTVGIFVIMGVACLAILSFSLGGVPVQKDGYYQVTAVFGSVTGLRPGASVEIAGVSVGKVVDITLDEYRASVTMKIRNGVKLSDDTVASVRTKGIIGEMFVKLSPGASDRIVRPGGALVETESAISMEELISKYIFEGK